MFLSGEWISVLSFLVSANFVKEISLKIALTILLKKKLMNLNNKIYQKIFKHSQYCKKNPKLSNITNLETLV